MSMIPKEIIDQIFETARIEEVIGEFVSLKKSGSNFKGLSPFVNEKTPSFMVSPAKGIFKDFSSGKGGNVVSFLMEHEGFSYPEALKWLGKYYNIEIPERELSDEEKAQLDKREALFVANAFAQQYFTEQFDTSEGKAIGLSYFRERGYREDIIKKFQLGYSPDHRTALTKAAKASGYNLELFEDLGLLRSKEGEHYDFFRGRVMFPIHSLTGRVLGFGGRTLRKDKKTAKYFNSPESEIYHKSNVLYGIYFARKGMMNAENCYLVEGYTDVISLHQAGIENVVASSGTALTPGQIRLIRRFTNNITILYDGDAAGIRASFRGIDLILEEGMNVKVVLFPEGEDPDSYSHRVNQEELKAYLDSNAKDFISFKTDVLLEETQGDPIKKAKLIREIVHSISLVPDPISRSVYIQQSSRQFEIAEQTLLNELNKLRRDKLKKESKDQGQEPDLVDLITAPDQPVVPQKKQDDRDFEFQELDIIRILLLYGDYGLEVENDEDGAEEDKIEIPVTQFVLEELEQDGIEVEHEGAKLIMEEYADAAEQGLVPNLKHFIQHQNQLISSLAVHLTADKYVLSENWSRKHHIYPETEEMRLQRTVEESVWMYKLRRVRAMKATLEEQLKQPLSSDELTEKMERIMKLTDVQRAICDRLGIVVTR